MDRGCKWPYKDKNSHFPIDVTEKADFDFIIYVEWKQYIVCRKRAWCTFLSSINGDWESLFNAHSNFMISVLCLDVAAPFNLFINSDARS